MAEYARIPPKGTRYYYHSSDSGIGSFSDLDGFPPHPDRRFTAQEYLDPQGVQKLADDLALERMKRRKAEEALQARQVSYDELQSQLQARVNRNDVLEDDKKRIARERDEFRRLYEQAAARADEYAEHNTFLKQRIAELTPSSPPHGIGGPLPTRPRHPPERTEPRASAKDKSSREKARAQEKENAKERDRLAQRFQRGTAAAANDLSPPSGSSAYPKRRQSIHISPELSSPGVPIYHDPNFNPSASPRYGPRTSHPHRQSMYVEDGEYHGHEIPVGR